MAYKSVCFFLLFFIVFFPTFLFGETASAGQVFLFFTFPAALFVFWGLISAQKNDFSIKIPNTGLVLVAMCILTLFTLLAKLSFIEPSLFINHLRYLAYTFVLIVSYNLAMAMRATDTMILQVLYKISFFSILFIALQLALPNNFLVDIITDKPAIDYLGFRIGGPFAWSYIFCFCMTVILFAGLHQFVRKEGNAWTYLVTFCVLLAYLLSQSKAAYISLIVFALFWVLMSLTIYKKNTRLLLSITLCLLCLTGLLIVFWELFLHVIGFFEKISAGQLDGSTSTRLKQFQIAEYTLNNNFLLGYPIKYLVIENAYVHYFYNYGIAGLFSYLFVFLCFLLDAIFRLRKAIKRQHGENIGLYIGMVCFTGSVFIYALGASPTDANKAAYFFYFLYGAFIAASQTKTPVSER